MKKILILFVSFLFLLPLSSQASILYSQTVSLSPGWNIVSTPRVLDSHTFSLPESSSNFDVYVLNASSSSGWSTLPSIGQTEFTPLFGYFINSKSTSTQTLTFNYAASTTPNQRFFERTFTKPGWYSIGVANPTYAKKVTDNRTDTNNPSSILNSLSGSYESVVDLTNESFSQDSNSVAVGEVWKQGIASDVNSLYDLRESKGYVMYMNQTSSLYSGFQNNDTPQTPASTTVFVINDPAFTTNTIIGGATNIPVGQYKMTASGEDIKVKTLQLTFATTTISTLQNVALYVDGGQVGISQNFIGQPLSYNLGSSFIIPLDGTSTLTVKADIVNATNTTAYTTGTIAAIIGGVSNNAEGSITKELVSVASSTVNSNTLTISSGVATFAKTSGFVSVNTSPDTAGIKIGSFTLAASGAESIVVNSIGVNPSVSGYSISNITNLTVKDGSTVLGTPVGSPSIGTTTFSFSNITIPTNGTKTFDIYADIGSASTGSTTASMSISCRGAVSNTVSTVSASGVTVTSVPTTLASSTLVSSSPSTQFVVGGNTQTIGTFRLGTLSSGTTANVRQINLGVEGTDAIESVTIGGVTAPVVSGNVVVTGLNLSVSSTGTDVPVTVKYAGFQNSTTGGSLQTSVTPVTVGITYVEATSGNGAVITNSFVASSSIMTLVASKPTVTVSSTQGGTLILGAENKVGEFTVTADANGKISVATTTISFSANGVTASEFTLTRIADGNTTISNTTVTGSSTAVIMFSPAYEISAGQSKTFSVYSTVNGTLTSGVTTPYVASSLSGSGFQWRDVIGGNTQFAGTNIVNFPTNSYTTAR